MRVREAARALLEAMDAEFNHLRAGVDNPIWDASRALRAALAVEDVPITRVEVIDHAKGGIGRVYTHWDSRTKAEVQYQDGGRSLKVFIVDRELK